MSLSKLLVLLLVSAFVSACNSTTRDIASQPIHTTSPVVSEAATHYGVIPGAVFEWDITRDGAAATSSSRIIGTKGLTIERARANGSIGYVVPFCWGCVVNDKNYPHRFRIEEEKYAALWPLEIGKSVTFTRTRSDNEHSWDHTITVTGKEKVTVPAGTYEAFQVTTSVTHNGGDWNAHTTHWWAPEVGYIVQGESQRSRGAPRRVGRAAKKITLPKR